MKNRVQLIIEEKEEEEVIEKSIAETLESLISDDDLVITIKWNIRNSDGYSPEPDDVLACSVSNFPALDIHNYLEHCGARIKYSCLGYHLNGKNAVPHIHYHLITEDFVYDKNPSQHRSRWSKKNGAGEYFGTISIKTPQKIDKTKPKYSSLAYTLKEGKHLRNWLPQCYVNIDDKTFNYLKDVGQSIYDKEYGLKIRQEKCEERKKNALLDLFILCDENKDKFNNYREMLLWLDKNYIAKLTVTEYPDPKNFKTNCQKVAVQLGLLTFSSLCL